MAGSSVLDRSFENGDTPPSDLLGMFSRPEWWADAACRGRGPADFFPTVSSPAANEAALAVCATCPDHARSECLATALRSVPRATGVWGGLTEKQRRRIRR